MEENLETQSPEQKSLEQEKLGRKRLREEVASQKELLVKQKADLKKATADIEKMAVPKASSKPVDYDKLTKELQAAWAENKENLEAMEERLGESSFGDSSLMKLDPAFRLLADYLGLSSDRITKYSNELSVILGWALHSTKDKNFLKAMGKIRELKTGLGFQEVGETSVKKLYRYIRLSPLAEGKV